MKKNGIVSAILVLGFCLSATAGTMESQTPVNSDPRPVEPGRPYYQCSAHHTDDDFRLHYGIHAASQCEAEESAVKVCEEFENHECEVHDCRYFLQMVDQ